MEEGKSAFKSAFNLLDISSHDWLSCVAHSEFAIVLQWETVAYTDFYT